MSIGHVHHIDNITMRRLPWHPLICPRTERKIGGSLTIDIYGTANHRFALFIAGSMTKPVTLPGFNGTWALPLPPLS